MEFESILNRYMVSKYLYLLRSTVDCQKTATLTKFALNIE